VRNAPATGWQFVELVCRNPRATLVLQTPQGKRSYLIEDPGKIEVIAREGGRQMDLHCGPQQPVRVRIEYAPVAGGETDGLVRLLHFDP
jgi:hypothetical protein